MLGLQAYTTVPNFSMCASDVCQVLILAEEILLRIESDLRYTFFS